MKALSFIIGSTNISKQPPRLVSILKMDAKLVKKFKRCDFFDKLAKHKIVMSKMPAL